MDLEKAIQDLYAERELLERVIASIEDYQGKAATTALPPAEPKRRGRKSMGADERAKLSERMRQHWASRRKERSGEDRARQS